MNNKMLPHFIIEQIKRLKKDNFNGELSIQPTLDIPRLPMPWEEITEKKPETDERGMIIIDLGF